MFPHLLACVLDACGAFGAETRDPSALRCGGVVLALAGAAVTHRKSSATVGKPLLKPSAGRSDDAAAAPAPPPEDESGRPAPASSDSSTRAVELTCSRT